VLQRLQRAAQAVVRHALRLGLGLLRLHQRRRFYRRNAVERLGPRAPIVRVRHVLDRLKCTLRDALAVLGIATSLGIIEPCKGGVVFNARSCPAGAG
jgi:hypothetical protein